MEGGEEVGLWRSRRWRFGVELRWGEDVSVLLRLCLYLFLSSKGMQMGSHFYVDGEIGRMMTVPRLFCHSTARITLLLVCDWKGAYLVSLFLFVVVKTDR